MARRRLGSGFALIAGAFAGLGLVDAPVGVSADPANPAAAPAATATRPAAVQRTGSWIEARRAWTAARAARRTARWSGTLAELVGWQRLEATAESVYAAALASADVPSGGRAGTVTPALWREAALDAAERGFTGVLLRILEGPLRSDRELLPLRAWALAGRGRPDSGLALLGWPPDRRHAVPSRSAGETGQALDDARLFVAGVLSDSARDERAARAAAWSVLDGDPTPAARRLARIRLARSLTMGGEPRLALSLLSAEEEATGEAAILAARARTAAGDTLQAARRLIAFAGLRGIPTADRHAALLRAADWTRAGLADSLDERSWTQLLRTLGEVGEAGVALDLIPLRRAPPPDSAAGLERIETEGILLARARRHASAAERYARLLRRADRPAADRARFALGLARSRRSLGEFAGADSAFQVAAQLDPGGASGDLAAWERAREWEQRRTPLESARIWAWAVPRVRSTTTLEASRVHLAIAWMRAGALDSAAAALGPDPESPMLAFWAGRVALARGDSAGARAAFRRAWEAGAWSYEGVRAAEELRRSGAWLPDSGVLVGPPGPPPRTHPSLAGDPPLRARLLEAVGLEALAREALIECARGEAAAGAGACHAALEERGIFRTAPPQDEAAIPRAEYPPAYPSEIVDAADSESVDASLLWAIMRQESGYNRAVRSRAGALGLLQLLPSTASALAGRRIPEESLLIASVNVPLGARYVRNLDREMGAPRAVLAAYNAGEEATRRWLRESGPVDDRWVELIPYRETRDYVKQVYAAWRRYEALYGSSGR